MNIIQLTYFLAVYDHDSYAAAAKELYTSRQTLGRAVYELEKELGCKLFARKGRSITPTDFGHEAAEITREILEGTQKLTNLAKGTAQANECTTFTLAILDNGFKGVFMLTDELERMFQSVPNVQISFQTLRSEQIEAALEVNAIDAAIMIGKNELPALSYEFIGKQRAYLAMRADHPLAKHPQLSISELGETALAQPADLRFLYQRVNGLCEAYGVSPQWTFVRQTEEDHVDFIQSGGAVFTEKNSLILQHNPDFVAVPMADATNLTYPFYYVKRKKDRSQAGRRIMRIAMEYLNENVFLAKEA